MGASARPGQKGRERKCTSVTNRSSILFDLLNESNGLGIADLNVENRKNLLTVRTEDGMAGTGKI